LNDLNDASLPYLIEYRLHEATGKLEVRIYGAVGSDPNGDEWFSRALKQTIIIEDFQNGDYGIVLPGVADSYADVGLGYNPQFTSGIPGHYSYAIASTDLPGYVGSYRAEIVAQYNSEVAYTSVQNYGLSFDGEVSGNEARFATAAAALMAMSALSASGNAANLIMTITGDDGNDTLRGFGVKELISGGLGNDALYGMGGNDRLYGGAGDDRIYGGTGADRIDGGTGTDTADYRYSTAGVTVNLATGIGSGGEAQGDQLISVENITGSSFGDALSGNDGVNRLVGLDGNDTLSGGAGNDILLGGMGADTLIGGLGDQDAASYQVASAGVIVNLATGGTGGEATDDTYNGIEYVYGSDFNDQISGDAAINRLTGGAGHDYLNGAGGNDYLLGETGNDTMTGGAGADVYILSAGFGYDTITDLWIGLGRTDRIWFQGTGLASYADVLANAVNTAAGVVITAAGQGTLTLSGVTLAQLNADDFLFG
jgi:Ca2+-binding RTX toxin-like protein